MTHTLTGMFAIVMTAVPAVHAQPFTHTALIPAGSDLSSIRFQGIRPVRVPVSSRITNDTRYCREVALGEPGGSMYCPLVEPEKTERAYEVTYSFDGPPVSSGESAARRMTFVVYFRPEEVGPIAQDMLLHRKSGRADAAGYFELSTSRESEPRTVVDPDRSTFCAGTYVDGAWVHANPGCQDEVKFATAMVPSDYFTVRVAMSAPKVAAAAE